MRAMFLTVLRRLAYSFLFLVGLGVLAVLVLTGTEGGTAFVLRTVLNQVEGTSSLRIATGDINGTLLGELSVDQLNVRDTGTGLRVNAEYLGLAFSVADLFNKHVHVSRLETRGLALTLPAATDNDDPAADPVAQLASLFSLPVTVAVDAIQVAPFTLTGASPFTLESINANVQLDNSALHLGARIVRDAGTVISPDLTLSADHTIAGQVSWQALLGEIAASGELAVSGDIATLVLQHELLSPALVSSAGSISTGLGTGSAPRFDLTHTATSVSGAAFGVSALENIAGSVTTAGTFDRIVLGGDAEVSVAPLGVTTVSVDALYADTALFINFVRLGNPRFDLDAEGNVAFADNLALNLSWRLANFSDGDLIDQVELVDVNGSGAITVSTVGNETLTELSLAALTGNLNGYPLSGSGEIAIAGNEINEVVLTLTSDVNSLAVNGSVTPQLALDWDLQAPVLTQLMSGLTGEIIGSGTLTGTPAAPQVAGSLNAVAVAYAGGNFQLQLETLSAEASYRGNDNAVTLGFSNLVVTLDDRRVEQTRGMAELSGTPASHAFSLSTQGPEYAVVMSGEGERGATGWQGALSALTINSPFGEWVLQESLALSVASDTAGFSNHCWLMADIRVCGVADWNTDSGLTGSLAVDNLPLAWLNDNLPDNVPDTDGIAEQLVQRPQGLIDLMHAYTIAMPESGLIEGMLDLSVDFTGVGGDWADTTLSAVLVPRDVSLGLIRAPATDSATDAMQVERYGIDDVDLAVQREAGVWRLQNSFGIYLAEAGGLDFQGNFQGSFSLDDDDVLGGDFGLTFSNIAWVEALAPTLSEVRGELGASGSISGTLARPLLNMDARLDNGSLRLPEFGLALNAVELDFRSVNSNEITITGSARSGAGTISLDSLLTMPLLDSRTLHVEVRGENFELLNTAETRMNVAPDLALDFREQVLNISGSLDVPLLHIDFTEREALSANGSIDVSRDVVIIENDEVQNVSSSTELLGRIPVVADIRLGMGDDVTFQGYGLNLAMTGNLDLEQSIDRPMLAHGELSITEGSYALYGQRLDIRNGRLLFLGNPLNPALDIRAVRETRVAEVGILMNGTARNIQGQLFSTPSLPESEILSLLVTGNSFGEGSGGEQSGENMLGAIALLGLEKGQGLTDSVTSKLGIDSVAINNSGDTYRDSSLGLGKYLSPNLFMRYDIGLFDRENVLTLDYILTERLRLEVETGVSQSVDLTYTVEK